MMQSFESNLCRLFNQPCTNVCFGDREPKENLPPQCIDEYESSVVEIEPELEALLSQFTILDLEYLLSWHQIELPAYDKRTMCRELIVRVKSMSVDKLREELELRGLPAHGRKKDMVKRYLQADVDDVAQLREDISDHYDHRKWKVEVDGCMDAGSTDNDNLFELITNIAVGLIDLVEGIFMM